MGMQDKSKERKDQTRGKSRTQADPMAGHSDRARDRAQGVTDPMHRDEAQERMRRERMERGGGTTAEEMLEDEVG